MKRDLASPRPMSPSRVRRISSACRGCCEKWPSIQAKETCYTGKRDLLYLSGAGPRPIWPRGYAGLLQLAGAAARSHVSRRPWGVPQVSKETYYSVKRDLLYADFWELPWSYFCLPCRWCAPALTPKESSLLITKKNHHYYYMPLTRTSLSWLYES
jgi:hypothetical protein